MRIGPGFFNLTSVAKTGLKAGTCVFDVAYNS